MRVDGVPSHEPHEASHPDLAPPTATHGVQGVGRTQMGYIAAFVKIWSRLVAGGVTLLRYLSRPPGDVSACAPSLWRGDSQDLRPSGRES